MSAAFAYIILHEAMRLWCSKEGVTTNEVRITKKCDDLGRVIIPKEARRMLVVNGDDKVDFVIEPSGRVYIEKHLPDFVRQNEHIVKLKSVAGEVLACNAWGC